VRIAALSDTHGQHNKLKRPEGFDVLIHAGDASNVGTMREFCRAIVWMGQCDNKNRIFVPGNHDRWVYENERAAKDICKQNGVTLLIDDMVEIDGARFYGTPWTLNFMLWAFMVSEEGMRDRLATMPKDVDVLISHGPAKGHLDAATDQGKIRHCGSLELLIKVQQVQPKLLICGHIHEGATQGSGGTSKLGPTSIYNVSTMNRAYQLFRQAVEIDL
jgi:Icc-related predicted phosphoesterase